VAVSRWRRNFRRRIRRALAKRLAEIADRAINETHVRPCTECGSTQLCEPDCRVAPWNLDDD
jgi:hypothetical protein